MVVTLARARCPRTHRCTVLAPATVLRYFFRYSHIFTFFWIITPHARSLSDRSFSM